MLGKVSVKEGLLMSEYIGITAICGDEGTGKTTMALSYPRPLVHLDIDVGGFDRAIWRMESEGVTSTGFPKPISIDRLKGADVTTTDQGKAPPKYSIRFPKRVEGMRELWQSVATKFVEACQDESVQTIVIDSATLLWNICHNSILQSLQDKQLAKEPGLPEDRLRERLQPVEYGPANNQMKELLHTARVFRKNLVLTHYPTDIYADRLAANGEKIEYKTGEFKLDGFKETGKLVDITKAAGGLSV